MKYKDTHGTSPAWPVTLRSLRHPWPTPTHLAAQILGFNGTDLVLGPPNPQTKQPHPQNKNTTKTPPRPWGEIGPTPSHPGRCNPPKRVYSEKFAPSAGPKESGEGEGTILKNKLVPTPARFSGTNVMAHLLFITTGQNKTSSLNNRFLNGYTSRRLPIPPW